MASRGASSAPTAPAICHTLDSRCEALFWMFSQSWWRCSPPFMASSRPSFASMAASRFCSAFVWPSLVLQQPPVPLPGAPWSRQAARQKSMKAESRRRWRAAAKRQAAASPLDPRRGGGWPRTAKWLLGGPRMATRTRGSRMESTDTAACRSFVACSRPPAHHLWWSSRSKTATSCLRMPT